MAWGVDDGVVPLLGIELLGGACDRDTALPFLFLEVHVKSEGEAALAQALGLSLQLLQLAFRQPAKLKDQAPCRGALATVDMATDDDGQMLLLGICRHDVKTRKANAQALAN